MCGIKDTYNLSNEKTNLMKKKLEYKFGSEYSVEGTWRFNKNVANVLTNT